MHDLITPAAPGPGGDTYSLATLHVADLVEYLNDLPEAVAAETLARLPLERATEVFDRPELNRSGELLQALPAALSASILIEMSADRAADVLRLLDRASQARLLAPLEPEPAGTLRRLLSYPEHSAGSLMTTELVSLPATATVAEALRHIREVERTRETVYAIYLLDPRTRVLLRTISLRRLITGEPEQKVMDLALAREPVTVTPETDRREVARLFARHDLLAVPVVDARRQVLGIVTVDDVIDAMVEQGTEEAHRFGGLEAVDKPYLRLGFGQMLRSRAGWLCVLFLGEMLTASAMQHFEAELEKAIVLTLFIPLIMSSGGNSGSQATSLIIRALALGQVRLRDWWRVAMREVPTGLALGGILGLLGIGRIALWQQLGIYDYGEHWALVALTVGLGLLGIVLFGSLTGSMLPFALQRLGFDPASASAPFVATLVDVTGLVIYFSVALMVLRGTLL
ncbi:magnesium transporter [Pseudoroseomonas ludipueritiae]|uniref:Magnesium transporter MgtE n=1 Tax=Pseudoroseomonas ludipueritiae TaxID=198093 RepID=A0ABR7R6D9_9PROT|nr:magnesium transporter [Pseudoroseomonas ludipueritiae]MBC9177320.1 magnesium transporter [Pseudoroseomonas ludipueritiae]